MTTSPDHPSDQPLDPARSQAPQPHIPQWGWDEWGNFSWRRFLLLVLFHLIGTAIGVTFGVACFWLGMGQWLFAAALLGFVGLQFAIIWFFAMRYLRKLLAARDAAQRGLEEAGWSASEASESVDTDPWGVDWVVRCRRGQQEVVARSRDRIKAWLEAARMASDGEWSIARQMAGGDPQQSG